jgi:hypothetical protein
MSTPPDEPTRRLPPSEPPPPRVREREVLAPEDDGYWLEELRDQIRALKTAAALLGVLAVTALGVALWALLADEDGGGGGQASRGASPERVSNLAERVDDLESRTKNAPGRGDLNDLETEQKGLADRLDALEESAGGEQSEGASQESVDAVAQDVQDLQQRLDQVEQQQEQDQGATP